MKKQSVNGKEASIIATYHDDENGKNYIIYTYGAEKTNAKKDIIYGYYKTIKDDIFVTPVDTVEDEKKILEILKILTLETAEENRN